MRRRIGILASLVLASSLGAATAGPVSAATSAAPSEQKVSLLYALSGASATMTLLLGSGNRYAFTLKGADAHTVWFSDRPVRLSGSLAVRFVRSGNLRVGGDSSGGWVAEVAASTEALQCAAHGSVSGGGLGQARVSVVSPTLAWWN